MSAKKKRRSGPSGTSGKNKQPQRLLRAAPELWEAVDTAVQRSGLTWSEWARAALLKASTKS